MTSSCKTVWENVNPANWFTAGSLSLNSMNTLSQKILLLFEPALCAAGSLISPPREARSSPIPQIWRWRKKKIPTTLSNVPWRERNLPMRTTDTYWCGEQTNSCLEVGERRTQEDYQGAAKTFTGCNYYFHSVMVSNCTLLTCAACCANCTFFKVSAGFSNSKSYSNVTWLVTST